HPATPLDGLSDDERRGYEALPGRGGATVDESAVAAALEPTRVLAPLAMLEVAGLAERLDGRWRIVRNRSGSGVEPPARIVDGVSSEGL
ncbi:MAG: hypothetical protein WB785_03715, partial [Mycobacterium sp.]